MLNYKKNKKTAWWMIAVEGIIKSLGFELTSTEQISFFKDDAGNDIYFEGGNFTKNLALESK